MNILHVVAGLAQSGGGLSELVPMFARAAAKQGHDVTLVTVARAEDELSATTREAQAAGVTVVRFEPCRPYFLYFSWRMLRGLQRLTEEAQVVHVHSNWTFPVWWACHCARVSGTPCVMTPHGCLESVRLRHSAWKKRLAGILDKYYLKRAAVIHATCEAEKEGIIKYLGKAPRMDRIVVIPNGVDLDSSFVRYCDSSLVEEKEVGSRKPEVGEQRPVGSDCRQFSITSSSSDERLNSRTNERASGAERTRTVLYLGRLHPLKGLDLLLEAWASLRRSKVLKCESALAGSPEAGIESSAFSLQPSAFPIWQLVIAGPDEAGHKAELMAKAKCLGLRIADANTNTRMNFRTNELPPDLIFAGPVFGEEKARLFASSDLFVLPTRNENFGITVAEALACGVPVITTKGAPWQELQGSSASSLVHYCDSALVAEKEVESQKSEVGGQRAARSSPINEQSSVSSFSLHPSAFAVSGRSGWWTDIGVEPLVDALREAMSLSDDERFAMGENGRRLVAAKYQWDVVAERMQSVYEAIMRHGP